MDYIALVITKTVCDNIKTLIDFYDQGSQSAASRRLKLNQRTLGRYMNGESPPNLSLLEYVATGYNLQPWQLLLPGLDPSNPPHLYKQTDQERDLYQRLKSTLTELDKLKS